MWYFHGENANSSSTTDVTDNDEANVVMDDMIGLLNDIYGTSHTNQCTNEDQSRSFDYPESVDEDEPNPNVSLFYRLLYEAKEKLHPDLD